MTHPFRKIPCLFLYLLGVFAAVPSPSQEKKDTTPPVNDSRKTLQELQATPQSVGAPVDPRTYKLGPEDIIMVRVWREPDLSGPMMVRPDGKISMFLVGEVPAAGRTPEELAQAITEVLLKTMTRPEVHVSVQQVNSKRYYLIGEINRTGAFSLVAPTTVLEAISAAGGLREYANSKKIVIVRGAKRLKFNYKEVVAGKNLQQNIFVEPGDQIIVP
ncbi:MAG TPA: polysaccharide biosynthesis/export family protein [Bryobacteraceae bacterium]|nr:polysaccharide biosynthesis/export family protein [Bryobacteraceae bacterium]